MDDIRVAIRLRPLVPQELSLAHQTHWQVNGNKIFQIDADGSKVGLPYTFDRIFDETCTTSQIYNDFALPILKAVMEGYHGTIFAYGQTSSGKTHTIMGSKTDKGLIPRMAQALFEEIENTPQRQYLLRVSYIEIYNEKVYDLFRADRKALNIREDLNGDTFIEEVKEEFVHNCRDLLNLMKSGESHRSYGSTRANDQSSRSHTIFKMTIESSVRSDYGEGEGDGGAVTISHLNLVDLAGSERAGQTGATGKSFQEGCSINVSLFSLRRVIAKLSTGEGGHVSFRDSKLTRILQRSLGGNTKTSIICTATPAMVEETHSTLKFASTAKIVKNNPVVNEVLSDKAKLKRYENEIDDLQKELEVRKQQDKGFQEMEAQLQESNRQKQELEARIACMDANVVKSSVALLSTGQTPKSRRETWGGNMGFRNSGSPLVLPSVFRVPLPPWDGPEETRSSLSPRATTSLDAAPSQRKVMFNLTDADSSALHPPKLLRGSCLQSKKVVCHGCQLFKAKLRNSNVKNNGLLLKCRKIEKELQWKSDVLKRERQDVFEAASFRAEEGKIIDELECKIKELENNVESLKKSSLDAQELYQESNKKFSVLTSDSLNYQRSLQVVQKELEDFRLTAEKDRERLESEIGRIKVAADKQIEGLTCDLNDYDLRFELQSERFNATKSELSAQLQDAYNVIETLKNGVPIPQPQSDKTDNTTDTPDDILRLQNEQLKTELESLRVGLLTRDEEFTLLKSAKEISTDSELAKRAAERNEFLQRLEDGVAARGQLERQLSAATDELLSCRRELEKRQEVAEATTVELRKLRAVFDELDGNSRRQSDGKSSSEDELSALRAARERDHEMLNTLRLAVEVSSSDLAAVSARYAEIEADLFAVRLDRDEKEADLIALRAQFISRDVEMSALRELRKQKDSELAASYVVSRDAECADATVYCGESPSTADGWIQRFERANVVVVASRSGTEGRDDSRHLGGKLLEAVAACIPSREVAVGDECSHVLAGLARRQDEAAVWSQQLVAQTTRMISELNECLAEAHDDDEVAGTSSPTNNKKRSLEQHLDFTRSSIGRRSRVCDRETELQIVVMEFETKEAALLREMEEVRADAALWRGQLQRRDEEMRESVRSYEQLAFKCHQQESSHEDCLAKLKITEDSLAEASRSEIFYKKLHSALVDELRRLNTFIDGELDKCKHLEATVSDLNATVMDKEAELKKLTTEKDELIGVVKYNEEMAEERVKESSKEMLSAQLVANKASQEQSRLEENNASLTRELIFLQDRNKKLKTEIRRNLQKNNTTIVTSKIVCSKCSNEEKCGVTQSCEKSSNTDSGSHSAIGEEQEMQQEIDTLKRKVHKYYKIIVHLQNEKKKHTVVNSHLQSINQNDKENTPEKVVKPAIIFQKLKTPMKVVPPQTIPASTLKPGEVIPFPETPSSNRINSQQQRPSRTPTRTPSRETQIANSVKAMRAPWTPSFGSNKVSTVSGSQHGKSVPTDVPNSLFSGRANKGEPKKAYNHDHVREMELSQNCKQS